MTSPRMELLLQLATKHQSNFAIHTIAQYDAGDKSMIDVLFDLAEGLIEINSQLFNDCMQERKDDNKKLMDKEEREGKE